MSILRVKDNQGNLITIPLLKGDKGDKGDQGIQGIPGTPGTNGVNGKDLPVGSITHIASSVAPTGFLVCNGDAVSRSAYPDLFTAIGTTYGAGDGSTTFNLPNLINEDYVVEHGGNSQKWYRIYKSGWMEQGGYIGASGNQTINFLESFADTNYVFVAQSRTNGTSDNSSFSSSEYNRSVSSIVVRTRWASGSNTGDATVQSWTAKGWSTRSALTNTPCIKAFGTTVNEGIVDVGSYISAVSGRPYIVSRSGTPDGFWQWIIWSDGWIEQLGWWDNGSNVRSLSHTFTLPYEMEYSTYYVNCTPRREGTGNQCFEFGVSAMSSTGVTVAAYGNGSNDLGRHLHVKIEGWMKDKPNV